MPPIVHYLIPIFGAIAVLLWRVSETTRPLTLRRIVIPPLGMSTGSLMFLYPPTRVPWSYALVAFVAGLTLLAFPLIATTELKLKDGEVYLRRSKAFMWVLLALFTIRLVLRTQIEPYLDMLQTGSVFYLLALGMILHWRVNMWFRFRSLQV